MESENYIFLFPRLGKPEDVQEDIVYAILNSIQFRKSSRQDAPYITRFIDIDNLSDEELDIIQNTPIHLIQPVGPVEFVNRIFELQSCAAIKPVNVPDKLSSYEYTHRRMRIASTDELCDVTCELNDTSVIKSETRTKAPENGLYHSWQLHQAMAEKAFPDDSWLISEYFPNIMAEYRAFVFKGKLLYRNSGRESPLRKLWDERPYCNCFSFVI